jgi:MFS family permease
MTAPSKFLTVKLYLAGHAVATVVKSIIPVLLPLCLLDMMPAQQYAALLVVGGLGQLLAVPLLSPASDRFGPARVLLLGECVFAMLLLLAVVLVAVGSKSLAAWAGYFVLSGLVQGLMIPAQSVIVQQMSPPEALERSLGWDATVNQVGRLAGPAVAALLLVTSAPQGALKILLAVWLLPWATHLMILLRVAAAEGRRPSPQTSAQAWWRDARDGARARWRVLTERWLLFQATAELLIIVPAFGLFLALAVHQSLWGDSALGWLQASCGCGIVLATAAGPTLYRRSNRWALSQLSGYATGVSLAAMGGALATGSLWLCCAAAFIANLCLGIRIFGGRVQRRVALPMPWVARFAAIHVLANSLAAQAGNAAGGLLADRIDLVYWYVLGGLLLFPLTWLARLIPGWKELINLPAQEATGEYARRWPAAFEVRKPV